jgi:hypothetical protein
MLSAGFCHLLADSLRNLPFSGRFPTATFLAALGYIVTLVADQIVHLVADSAFGAGAGTLDSGCAPRRPAAWLASRRARAICPAACCAAARAAELAGSWPGPGRRAQAAGAGA